MTAQSEVAAVPFHPGLFEWPVAAGSSPRLTASRCPACGRYSFPAKRSCPFCQGGEQQTAYLSGHGRLYAFAEVKLPPKLMGRPYIAAYADLDERVRVFAEVVDTPVETLRIGAAVRVDFRVLRHDSEGSAVIGYVLVPSDRRAR